MNFREEEDSLGIVLVPEDACYGAQTQRAAENSPTGSPSFPSSFIRSLGLIKKCAATVNYELGFLDEERAAAIVRAAAEVMEGRFDGQFVVGVFQTGSGTSTNMNANEVIAGRANEILTGRRGGKTPVHPNDHVNLGQSSNDVIPTCIHVAAVTTLRRDLLPSLDLLLKSLAAKVMEFSGTIKMGRTHLQDALPITLGQEFSGYARQVELGIQRIRRAEKSLLELALGGTAVGNGANAHPDFAPKVIALVSRETGCLFVEAANHFEAQAARDSAVEMSGTLKTLAVSLSKIANDIRWLASGPQCGLGELNLPSLQPGSSIMPGKVNPVLPEIIIQAAAQVIGNDAAITIGGQGGTFELNAMLPLIAHNLLGSLHLLSASTNLFAVKCVQGISANAERCGSQIEKSPLLATYFAPHIGYDRASRVARKARETGRTVREIVLEENILPAEDVERILRGIADAG